MHEERRRLKMVKINNDVDWEQYGSTMKAVESRLFVGLCRCNAVGVPTQEFFIKAKQHFGKTYVYEDYSVPLNNVQDLFCIGDDDVLIDHTFLYDTVKNIWGEKCTELPENIVIKIGCLDKKSPMHIVAIHGKEANYVIAPIIPCEEEYADYMSRAVVLESV